MSKELEYFQDIIKVDEEALTLANKEKSKKQDVMLHRQWLNQRKNVIEQALKENEQYKAIEQELGIDLITFIKLLECQYARTTIFVKTSPRAKKVEMKEKLELFADLKTKSMKVKSVARYPTWDTELVYRGCYHSYDFKDYGKTWALTREELEK